VALTDSPGQGPVNARCYNLTSELPSARVAPQHCPDFSAAGCELHGSGQIVKNKIKSRSSTGVLAIRVR